MTTLVTGATGLLGGYLVEELRRAGEHVVAVGGPGRAGAGVELTDERAVHALAAQVRPDVIFHTAALSALADCARAPERARQLNSVAAATLAEAADGARFVHVSTDMVFDGEAAPYREGDPPAPTSVYGRTKREAELAVLAAAGRSVVVRVSLLFGPTKNGRRGFFDHQLAQLQVGNSSPLVLFDDEWRTPLSLRVAAEALVAIGRSDVGGVLHLGGPERLSRFEIGQRLAGAFGLAHLAHLALVRGSRTAVTGPEPRPRDLSLDSSLFRARFPALVGLVSSSFEDECRRMA
jgi:dTDP-4-dehydrorhamnose reductase